MSAQIAYISASSNRHSYAADVSSSSCIAFGSSKLVAIWEVAEESDASVSKTLFGHSGLVTCARFITKDLLASADDQGVVIIWNREDSDWKKCAKIPAHAAAISSLCSFGNCIVTGASDSLVKIWDVDDSAAPLQERQVIDLKGRYPLALALAKLPQSQADVLAISGTDRNIQVWVRSDSVFVLSAILSGHEDWVKGLAFMPPRNSEEPLILASGSQDATIRLWNFEVWNKDVSLAQSRNPDALNDELLDAFEASLGDLGDAEEGGRQISLRRHILTVRNDAKESRQYSITFDALLVGHDAGITSLAWRPRPASSDSDMTLLSTSTDSSVILWSPAESWAKSDDVSKSSALWINIERFGDIGGQRLGGFVGGLWSPDGLQAYAWGWAGGWRKWRRHAESNIWVETGAVGGHKGPVKWIDWSPDGEYLISAGLDQTTRIHAVVPLEGLRSWHEIARPQVHGYDLLGVSFLDPLRFVSIADEKVARVFEAPRKFVGLVEHFNIKKFADVEHERPEGANVPPLGLSNKATSDAPVQAGIHHPPTHRPFEGELASATLWPEIEKIFGHGYESISLAVSPVRRLIATACKATTPEHAVVRIYDSAKYEPVGQPLEGHSLTVTRIAFSPDDHYALTVSRDRSWRLFETQDAGGYLPIAADKSHGRIIWDCAWTHEGDAFATASRDKTVKIWNREDTGKWITAATIKTNHAATAVDFSPADPQHSRLLAIGLESGEILIYKGQQNESKAWSLRLSIDSNLAHADHIYRVAWRPHKNGAPLELASCSEDGTLKILIVQSG